MTLLNSESMVHDTVVLYHRGCNDGIVAAWAARGKLGDSAIYLPYQYGEDTPLECVDKHVIMVDLSLKLDRLDELKAKVKSVLIIDHHKTAIELEGHLIDVRTYSDYLKLRDDKAEVEKGMLYLDQNYSGAVLSWAFFNDLVEIDLVSLPIGLQHVHDYDLWIHELEETKAVNAWLINDRLTMERVDLLMSDTLNLPESILDVGNALLRYDDKIIRSVVREYVQIVDIGDGKVAALVNAPHHLRNELSDLLSDRYAYVVVYSKRKNRTVYSLRSKKDSYDVSEIAARFGGGGHSEAAAFSTVHSELDDYVQESVFVKPRFMRRLKMAWKVLLNIQ